MSSSEAEYLPLTTGDSTFQHLMFYCDKQLSNVRGDTGYIM